MKKRLLVTALLSAVSGASMLTSASAEPIIERKYNCLDWKQYEILPQFRELRDELCAATAAYTS